MPGSKPTRVFFSTGSNAGCARGAGHHEKRGCGSRVFYFNSDLHSSFWSDTQYLAVYKGGAMKVNLEIMGIGSVELEGMCYELRQFLQIEPKSQADKAPLIRGILSDQRLCQTRGFLESGSSNWKNMQYLLRSASVCLEDMEKELKSRS